MCGDHPLEYSIFRDVGMENHLPLFTAKIKLAKGVHALYLDFVAEENDLLHVDWFEFNKAE
jgi:hypothetical protein